MANREDSRPISSTEAINSSIGVTISGVASSPTEGDSSAVANSPTEGDSSAVANSPTEGDSSAVANSPTEGDSSGVANSPTEGDSSPVANSPTEGDSSAAVANSPTEGDSSPVANSPTEGDSSPVANSTTEGDSSAVANSPTEGDSSPVANSPTEGDSSDVANSPTEGDSSAVANSPTEGDSSPVASSPTGDDSSAVASSPTGGDSSPVANSPTGNSTLAEANISSFEDNSSTEVASSASADIQSGPDSMIKANSVTTTHCSDEGPAKDSERAGSQEGKVTAEESMGDTNGDGAEGRRVSDSRESGVAQACPKLSSQDEKKLVERDVQSRNMEPPKMGKATDSVRAGSQECKVTAAECKGDTSGDGTEGSMHFSNSGASEVAPKPSLQAKTEHVQKEIQPDKMNRTTVSISVCTSSPESSVQGLLALLRSWQEAKPELIAEVKFHPLPYNDIDEYRFKYDDPVDVMILCHSIFNRRFAITDVMDALYDKYLDYCNTVIGKEKMVVIAHDFKSISDDANSSRQASFKITQPKAFDTTSLAITCGNLAKKEPEIRQEDSWQRAKSELIAKVKFHPLPYNNIDECKFKSNDPVDVMILCHSISNRGFSITNVDGAIYDRYLDYCSGVIGKEKMAVIGYDFKSIDDDTSSSRQASFKIRQPKIFDVTSLVITCGSLAQREPEIRQEDRASLLKFIRDAGQYPRKMRPEPSAWEKCKSFARDVYESVKGSKGSTDKQSRGKTDSQSEWQGSRF
ncbi:uncharacterized protein [Diadema antillarum]|uniref:uncharacterized protein n=1 Tax=Diadema antillarum TaxID=105358 RepID=UPI003A87EDCA